MKKNMTSILSIILLCGILLSACSSDKSSNASADTLYQTSTIQALLVGNYDGLQSIEDLKTQGNLGIGTFDALDGELVMIDQKVYQVKASGEVLEVVDSITTPFAAVTFFDEDIYKELENINDYDSLKIELDKLIEHEDLFYAFRIDATFQYVMTRSVPAQEKPYPVLSEVTKNQPVFEYTDVPGSLVGFWCPSYVGGINVPGYHLHFISDDRTMGGHLLDMSFEHADISIDITDSFNMELSQSNFTANLEDVNEEIDKVE